MSAWGETGRVTLGAEWGHGSDIARDVTLPGNVAVGRVLAPRGDGLFTRWAGITLDPWCYRESIPSLDAAVMWVLRRAAPDVWRAERGPVARVLWRQPGQPERFPWAIARPDGELESLYESHAEAIADAEYLTRVLSRESAS